MSSGEPSTFWFVPCGSSMWHSASIRNSSAETVLKLRTTGLPIVCTLTPVRTRYFLARADLQSLVAFLASFDIGDDDSEPRDAEPYRALCTGDGDASLPPFPASSWLNTLPSLRADDWLGVRLRAENSLGMLRRRGSARGWPPPSSTSGGSSSVQLDDLARPAPLGLGVSVGVGVGGVGLPAARTPGAGCSGSGCGATLARFLELPHP